MTDLNYLLSTTDAQKWARAFMQILDVQDVDESLMLTWFAAAIETGRKVGRRDD
jgi:hypothetical protein